MGCVLARTLADLGKVSARELVGCLGDLLDIDVLVEGFMFRIWGSGFKVEILGSVFG